MPESAVQRTHRARTRLRAEFGGRTPSLVRPPFLLHTRHANTAEPMTMTERKHEPSMPSEIQVRRPTAASVWRQFESVAERYSSRHAALTEIARMIANQLDVDVCSIYECDDITGELVLSATMGLNQSAVGVVRMKSSRGLVGLVAQELQPVYVEDAPSHRRFEYFPEAGEDPYVTFFGVPVMSGGMVHGVLVVQTAEPRDLTSEWAAIAMAAQRLAPIVGRDSL